MNHTFREMQYEWFGTNVKSRFPWNTRLDGEARENRVLQELSTVRCLQLEATVAYA